MSLRESIYSQSMINMFHTKVRIANKNILLKFRHKEILNPLYIIKILDKT